MGAPKIYISFLHLERDGIGKFIERYKLANWINKSKIIGKSQHDKMIVIQ